MIDRFASNVDVRPEGDPPLPEMLSVDEHPEWVEYIRSICAQIEAWEADKMTGYQSLSLRGDLAVQLVDLLQVE